MVEDKGDIETFRAGERELTDKNTSNMSLGIFIKKISDWLWHIYFFSAKKIFWLACFNYQAIVTAQKDFNFNFQGPSLLPILDLCFRGSCPQSYESLIELMVTSNLTDINAKLSDNKTALQLAAENQHDDLIRLLLKLGADPLQLVPENPPLTMNYLFFITLTMGLLGAAIFLFYAWQQKQAQSRYWDTQKKHFKVYQQSLLSTFQMFPFVKNFSCVLAENPLRLEINFLENNESGISNPLTTPFLSKAKILQITENFLNGFGITGLFNTLHFIPSIMPCPHGFSNQLKNSFAYHIQLPSPIVDTETNKISPIDYATKFVTAFNSENLGFEVAAHETNILFPSSETLLLPTMINNGQIEVSTAVVMQWIYKSLMRHYSVNQFELTKDGIKILLPIEENTQNYIFTVIRDFRHSLDLERRELQQKEEQENRNKKIQQSLKNHQILQKTQNIAKKNKRMIANRC